MAVDARKTSLAMDVDAREAMAAFLEGEGYHVVGAANGREALVPQLDVNLVHLGGKAPDLWYHSAEVIKMAEDKQQPGAIVASLALLAATCGYVLLPRGHRHRVSAAERGSVLMGAIMGVKLLFAKKGERLPILLAGPIPTCQLEGLWSTLRRLSMDGLRGARFRRRRSLRSSRDESPDATLQRPHHHRPLQRHPRALRARTRTGAQAGSGSAVAAGDPALEHGRNLELVRARRRVAR